MISWLSESLGLMPDGAALGNGVADFHLTTDHKICRARRHLKFSNVNMSNASNRNYTVSTIKLLCLGGLLMGVRAQQTTAFPAQLNLASLTGQEGFIINGEDVGDLSGSSVAGGGDFNGDGIGDLLISAPMDRKAHVVFGKSGLGAGGALDLTTLNAPNSLTIHGSGSYDSRGSLSAGGDVNGDGIDDLLIGAYEARRSGSEDGKAYVVFGSRTLHDRTTVDLRNLDGSNGFVMYTGNKLDHIGYSVSILGDVNGDTIDDMLIGGPDDRSYNNGAGQAFVVFGKKGLGSSGALSLLSLKSGDGVIISGSGGYFCGSAASSAGDVNNDGMADLMFGCTGANHQGKIDVGLTYVVFGAQNLGGSGSLMVSDINGSNGFYMYGEQANDDSGNSVSSADVNGDGISDLIVGASKAAPGGKVYVLFGKRDVGSSGSIGLSSLTGSNGLKLSGESAGDELGYSVADAGDINGDGISDLVIGARYADFGGKLNVGKTYLLFGNTGFGAGGSIDLSSLSETSGFVMVGDRSGDQSGHSVSGIGDVNGDGIPDLIIGAPRSDRTGGMDTGRTYVVFGRDLRVTTTLPPLTTLVSTSSAPTIQEPSRSTSIAAASGTDIHSFTLASVTQPGQTSITAATGTDVDSFTLATATQRTSSRPSGVSLPNSQNSIALSKIIPSASKNSVPAQTSLIHNPATADAVDQSSTGASDPVVIGLVAAVAALACSLFAGGILFFKRRSPQHETPTETGLGTTVSDSIYTSPVALPPEMVSAREEAGYQSSPNQPSGHYSSIPQEPQPHGTGHYSKLSLDQLNQDHDKYMQVKFEKARANYNALPT